MKRKWTLIAVSAALILVVGAALLIKYLPNKEPKAPTDADKPELSRVDKEKLLKIDLKNASGSLVLEKKDKTWSLVPPQAFPLSESSLDDLAYSFASLYAERVVDEAPKDLAQYGLATPKAVAVGTFEGGIVKTFLVGDKTPSGDTYYLMVKDDPKVYTVWMNHGEHFNWTARDLREKKLPVLNAEEISYMLLTKDGATMEIKEKTSGETSSYQYGFSKYMMTRPYKFTRGVDGEKIDPILKGIPGIVIDDFVDDAPKSLAAYGLDRPWADILARDKSITFHVLLGAKNADRYYFKLADAPNVYLVDGYKVDFLKSVTPFSIADKFTFIPNIDDVDRLDISSAGVSHSFTMTRIVKKAAKAGDADETVTSYFVDGKAAEEDSFKKTYQAIIGLQIEGELTHAPAAGAPVVTTRYFLNKGDSKDVTVSYLPYDKNFYAVSIAGKIEFGITHGQLDAMLVKVEALARGEKVTD